MSLNIFTDLLDGNDAHVKKLNRDFNELLDDIKKGQNPEYVTVCCSDSRVSNEHTFDHRAPGINFTIGEIGNNVVDFNKDGNKVISGNVSYIPCNKNPDAIVVLGHTGCGAVTATHSYLKGESLKDQPEGVQDIVKYILAPNLEKYMDRIPESDEDIRINHLVEYNVDEQIKELKQANEIPKDIELIGMVYDIHESYGGKPGTAYLVNYNGIKDKDDLANQLPDQKRKKAKRLTY